MLHTGMARSAALYFSVCNISVVEQIAARGRAKGAIGKVTTGK